MILKKSCHLVRTTSQILLILTILSFSYAPIKKSMPSDVSHLSAQEKEYLFNFFKYAFFLNSSGYTLFGNKPMSFDRFNFEEESKSVDGFDYTDIFHINDCYRVKEGLAVWEKYFARYPLNGFSFLIFDSLKGTGHKEILLINHENFLKVVSDNIEDFSVVLEKNLTPKEILDGYIQAKGDIFFSIHSHEGLFGTLLGYGRNNAWEYWKNTLGKRKLPACFPQDPHDTNTVMLPTFAALPETSETKYLIKSYSEQKIKIDKICQSDNFLEKVLQRLIGT